MKNKAFTLIELVVAIAILGVLMIIAIPSVKYIQAANKNAKFKAYGKAITAAGKAYTDAYSEDLFGVSNTGCAIISYTDLKSRSLIEDIQLKNANCGTTDTCVIVKKAKNGNYHYDTNLSCNENGKLAFKDVIGPCSASNCGLEDGKGPTLTITDSSGYGSPKYYVDEQPKLQVTIRDIGIGLKANQTVNYQWYKNDQPMSGYSGTIQFKNKNYETAKTRSVSNPLNMDVLTESTKYKLVLSGSIEDIDNNKTYPDDKWSYTVDYFVGHVLIKMHTNGGKLIDPHGNQYYVDANENVVRNSDKSLIISRIPYKGNLGSSGLLNCDNPEWLNVGKTGYHPLKQKEWNTKTDGSGKPFDQAFNYKDTDFYNNVRKQDYNVDLYINWEINTYTLKYDDNGGSGCSDKTKTQTHGSKWGTLCTPTRRGYSFNGWKFGSTTINANTLATSDVKLVAQWTGNACTITYRPNSGTFNNNSNQTTQTCYYGNTCNLYDATSGHFNATRTGYHAESGTAWKDGSTTYTQVSGNYRAENICSGLDSGDRTKTLDVNWHTNVCTITFDPNGGSFGSHNNSSDKTQKCNYNNSCNLKDAKSGYFDSSKKGYHIDSDTAWTDGSSNYTQAGSTYTALNLCGNDLKNKNVSKTFKVHWIGNVCTITYDSNDGSFGSHNNSSDKTQKCNYGSGCNLKDATSGYFDAKRNWHHVESSARAWRNNGEFYSQVGGNYKAENICDNLDEGNKSKTLYVSWDTNKLYLQYYTNGGHLSASPDQACPLTIPSEYRSGCTRTNNLSGCTGNRSGHVFTSAGALHDSDGFSSKGLRDYSSSNSADGVHWNLFMRYNNHSGTGKWLIGSSSASKKISEDTRFTKVEDFAEEIGKKDEFKHSNITVKLYAEWS